MSRPPARAATALVAALLLVTPAVRADDAPARLAEYMDAVVRARHFQGAVLVARGGEPLLRAGYGAADAEHDAPNGPETKFRLGSITKQFTAMAVLILADRGELALDDPIGEHLDDAPEAWSGVTIHHLLSHTSGIPSYTDAPDYRDRMAEPTTVEGMIARFRDRPPEFEPGEKFRYSNSGYFLLGAIIEKVSGASYEDFLTREVFEPLGMADSGYDRPEKVLAHRAEGYVRRRGELQHDAYLDMNQPYAAGSLYSTVDDLRKWDRALAAGELISPGLYEKMFAPVEGDYAYGWSVPTVRGRQHAEHGGGINGFATYLLRVPSEDLLVVVLSNAIPTNPEAIARDLASVALGDPFTLPEEPKVVAVDPAVLERYAGRYRFAPDFAVTVFREGDRLIGRPDGQNEAEMVPRSESEFHVPEADALIRFVADAEGRVTHLILEQGGREHRAEREGDGPGK